MQPHSSRTIAASALSLAFALCASPAAHAANTWITIGDAAYAVLQQTVPAARTLSSVQVAVQVPAQRGTRRSNNQLVTASEGVYAVEIDEDAITDLSTTLHERLHKCAGFVQHSSQAQALAALQQLQNPVPPSLVPSYVIDNQTKVNQLLPVLQASNILSNIEQLASFQNRRYKSSGGVAASDYLYNLWKTMGSGRRDIRVNQVTHPNWSQKSVTLDIEGTGNNTEVIVLGAHLDSISSGPMETSRAPGADDDASGVATLTEILRAMVATNYTPARTLRFIAYAAEELGLLGSQEIVLKLSAERKKVVGVMQLDMTAYQGSASDLWIFTDYTNAAQNQFVANLAATYLPELTVGYDACGYACSDHAVWHVNGYAASLPFESSDATYNPYIHTPNDTTAIFGTQANHALKFGKLALAYMVELGSDLTPATRPAAAAAASPSR